MTRFLVLASEPEWPKPIHGGLLEMGSHPADSVLQGKGIVNSILKEGEEKFGRMPPHLKYGAA